MTDDGPPAHRVRAPRRRPRRRVRGLPDAGVPAVYRSHLGIDFVSLDLLSSDALGTLVVAQWSARRRLQSHTTAGLLLAGSVPFGAVVNVAAAATLDEATALVQPAVTGALRDATGAPTRSSSRSRA